MAAARQQAREVLLSVRSRLPLECGTVGMAEYTIAMDECIDVPYLDV